MDVSGKWRNNSAIHGATTVTFERDGEAWSMILEGTSDTPSMRGVAFEHEGFLCLARGIVLQSADLDGTVGLVQYDIQNFGSLPARWYHPSLGGKLSEGFSANGPEDMIVGEYQADYQDSEGSAFSPLRKTIARAGPGYQFSWWDEERFHYLGVGREVHGALFAAWGPPGSIIQFVYYNLRQPGDSIHGEWIDYGRNRHGSEMLSRY